MDGDKQSGRIDVLDSLRGAAALTVLLWHCFTFLNYDARMHMGWLLLTPLRVLINGPAAVTVFFVLSGFVLALPFLRVGAPRYTAFVLRRCCRICLPYYAALVLAMVLYWLMDKTPLSHAGVWKNGVWLDGEQVTTGFVLSHLYIFLWGNVPALDGPAWSLVHELRISLIMPLLVILARNPGRALPAAVALYGVTLAVLVKWGNFLHFPDTALDPVTMYGVTLYVVPCFILGAVLATRREALLRRLRSLPDLVIFLLWMAVWGAFSYMGGDDTAQQTVYVLAAAVLIMLAQSTGAAIVVLGHPVLRWMGRISYSLYLVHMPILWFMIRQCADTLPPVLLVACMIVVCLLTAVLMHRLVEAPAQALGRWLTASSRTGRAGRAGSC